MRSNEALYYNKNNVYIKHQWLDGTVSDGYIQAGEGVFYGDGTLLTFPKLLPNGNYRQIIIVSRNRLAGNVADFLSNSFLNNGLDLVGGFFVLARGARFNSLAKFGLQKSGSLLKLFSEKINDHYSIYVDAETGALLHEGVLRFSAVDPAPLH